MYKYKAIKVNGRKIDEHRYVMECHLGRKLSRNEVVHHKDGNKRNNNIDNLELVSRRDHSKMHMTGSVIKQSTRTKLINKSRENRHNAKISIKDITEIRNTRNISISEIAKKFNVHRSCIYKILERKTYYWVT